MMDRFHSDLQKVQFIVPGTPVPKARPRIVAGHAFTPQRTADYEELVRVSYISQTESNCRKFEENCPLRAFIDCVYHYPQNWSKKKIAECKAQGGYKTSKGDADNLGKAVLDSLNNLAYKDDSQITDMRVVKRYGETDFTRVVIEVIQAGDTNGRFEMD